MSTHTIIEKMNIDGNHGGITGFGGGIDGNHGLDIDPVDAGTDPFIDPHDGGFDPACHEVW